MSDTVYNGNVPGLSMEPQADTSRDWLLGLVNPGAHVKSDWQLAEQSANNALARDMYYLNASNAFNAEQAQINRAFQAEEAQKVRDYETQMSNTAYQRAVADMKIAGINPIVGLGLANNGAFTPSTSSPGGSTASSSGGRSSPANSGSRSSGNSGALSSLLSLIAGLVTKGKNGGLLTQSFNSDGELIRSTIKTKMK